ncbi:MAG: class I SAM-dependent methyltransferase [Phycisphaerae bacterium]|nr:class I SAM-dependent methyltransferase [Phycisphaerae bacterium]
MDPQRVQTVLAELEHFMSRTDDALNLPRESAEFVHALVLSRGCRRVVEIGTSYGYSGIWIASGLAASGGQLITIDRERRKTDTARVRFEEAGLSHVVDFRVGRAVDLLPAIDGPIDFVLNDADKENCIRYVEILAEKLSERAILLTDNTTSHATQLAPFLEWIHRRDDFFTVIVPIGNGMALSVKRGG